VATIGRQASLAYPQVNAPQGDWGVVNSPQLHMVPVTPTSRRALPTVPLMNDPAESAFFSPSLSLAPLHIGNLDIFTAPTPPKWNTEATTQENDYAYSQDHGYSPSLPTSNLYDLNDDDYDYDHNFLACSSSLPSAPYRGSLYATHSEFEFDENTIVVDDNQPDYDPTEYDAPSDHLLEFMNSDSDFSSPASSNGLPDQESEANSRTSSVSSYSNYYHTPPPIPAFESLEFCSPHWNTSHTPADKSSPLSLPPWQFPTHPPP